MKDEFYNKLLSMLSKTSSSKTIANLFRDLNTRSGWQANDHVIVEYVEVRVNDNSELS